MASYPAGSVVAGRYASKVYYCLVIKPLSVFEVIHVLGVALPRGLGGMAGWPLHVAPLAEIQCLQVRLRRWKAMAMFGL